MKFLFFDTNLNWVAKENWSKHEVELIVNDYFGMLIDEIAGHVINKTIHRNALMPLLKNRSAGSIEFKHQNISAVLIKYGLPFINGYKPKWNFQQILEESVLQNLREHKDNLEPKFVDFADSEVTKPSILDFKSILQQPPEKETIAAELKHNCLRKPMKINYLEREQRNALLGTQGEDLALGFEKWRLDSLGKNSLAEKVEWISKYDDSAGFDILSKNENGTDRYIEVKTTKLTKYAPIFFTINEYEFSMKNRTSYHLYRIFEFCQSPKLFTVSGSFDDFCGKEAIIFAGRF